LILPADHPDVPLLLQEIIALYRPFAVQKRIGLELDCPADLQPSKVNGLGLRLVVANLVENAIKYSPPGSSVTVRTMSETEGDLRVVVEDDGPGVPEEQRERIFQRFVRGPGHDATVPGSGLGLYIARSLARAMGGNIAYRPVDPHGSRFTATVGGHT
jgi:signal transduction histidine kinase